MVWIVQCLCPSRHAILGVAFDDTDMGPSQGVGELRVVVGDLVERGVINDHCGLCGSRSWTYELGKTKYHSIEEAQGADPRAIRSNALELRL
jgi:hypothetical protein